MDENKKAETKPGLPPVTLDEIVIFHPYKAFIILHDRERHWEQIAIRCTVVGFSKEPPIEFVHFVREGKEKVERFNTEGIDIEER